jgi:hypothetical protein
MSQELGVALKVCTNAGLTCAFLDETEFNVPGFNINIKQIGDSLRIIYNNRPGIEILLHSNTKNSYELEQAFSELIQQHEAYLLAQTVEAQKQQIRSLKITLNGAYNFTEYWRAECEKQAKE